MRTYYNQADRRAMVNELCELIKSELLPSHRAKVKALIRSTAERSVSYHHKGLSTQVGSNVVIDQVTYRVVVGHGTVIEVEQVRVLGTIKS